jgi:hypothetical protein
MALRADAPGLTAGAIAIVDSPLAPIDVDCSGDIAMRAPVPAQRNIDTALRRMVASLDAGSSQRLRFAMFPTPKLAEFSAFIDAAGCKPHLVTIGRRIFGHIRDPHKGAALPRGRSFTRFMLAGFATHLALGALGARAFEGYPFLAFSLWKSPGATLPPKSNRDALLVRARILEILARAANVDVGTPVTLDQADAAALALSVAARAEAKGTALAIADPAEGQFIVALPTR